MTIEKTRKILELDDRYSDDEVQLIIDETMRLAKFFLNIWTVNLVKMSLKRKQ